MPHGFEYIVRPYQSPDSLGGNVIPATPKGTRERAQLTWGGKGTMPTVRFTGIDFNTQKSKKEVALTEQDRESDIVRIEQPGKPENYVDVARAKKMKLSLEEKTLLPNKLGKTKYTESELAASVDEYRAFMTPLPDGSAYDVYGDETWTLTHGPKGSAFGTPSP